MLIRSINKEFLICSNQQTQCLLQGAVDQDGKFITAFGLLIGIPLLKDIYLNNYAFLFIEYLVILTISVGYIINEFNKSNRMKEQYIQAEE